MIKYAISLVFRRKLRTLLTSLGITISVILLSFIIFGMQGLRSVITNEFDARFKPNQLIISSQSLDFGFSPGSADDAEKEPVFITQTLIDELSNREDIEKVDPQLIVYGFKIELIDSGKRAFDPAFIAGLGDISDASYYVDFIGEKTEPLAGEAFVGNAVADFYGLTPDEIIGKQIQIVPSFSSVFNTRVSGILNQEYTFNVVGYIDSGIDRLDLGLNREEAASIAANIGGFESGEEYLNTFGYDQAVIDVKDLDKVNDVKEILKTEYGLEVFSSEDITEIFNQITVVLTLGLTFFGLISALVASIGIINTMVMSIYEQTKEIGIIKAIGASNKQVMSIFLIQSGMIGFIGAIIGLIFVTFVMFITDPVIVDILKEEGLTSEHFYQVDIVIALVITLISILVGIIAGLYPAIKAARLDPVKALRYE